MKECVGCKVNQRNDHFYPAKNSEDGLNRYCKQCCKVNRGAEAVRKRDKRVKISVRQIHRCRALGVEVDESITLAKLFKRDRGICHLCKKWVQPRHASPDHHPSLNKGGSHTWKGIRLTHLKCNLRKGVG